MARMWKLCHLFSLLVLKLLGCFLIFPNECYGLSANNNYSAHSGSGEITHRASAIFALMESMKKKNAFAIRILEQDPAYLSLDQRDRAFARLLLSTAERRSGQIESVIQSFQRKDNKKKSKVCRETKLKLRVIDQCFSRNEIIKNWQCIQFNSLFFHKLQPRLSDILADAALRIGAVQILFMDTPVYAAVSETVESLRMHPKIKVSYVLVVVLVAVAKIHLAKILQSNQAKDSGF